MMSTADAVKEILIVEDDLEMQQMYRLFFNDQAEKYTIEVVGDARSALKKINAKQYDLVILDIIMEPIAGDSFYLYVRECEETRDLPILIVSVLKPETLERLKKVNHVDFLQKPILPNDLIRKVDRILAR